MLNPYVKAPILINAYKNSDGSVTFSNDVFSIVDSTVAEPTIRSIQQQLIQNCTRRNERSFMHSSHSLPLFSEQKIKSLLTQCLENGYSSREFRSFVNRLDVWKYMSTSPDSFEQFLSCVGASNKNDDLNQLILKHAVMISTGPAMYVEAMSQYINLWTILYHGKIADNFENLQLTRSFQGQGGNNSQNDCSWLESGHNSLVYKEEIMTKQAIKIQRFSKHRLFHHASTFSAASIGKVSDTESVNMTEAKY